MMKKNCLNFFQLVADFFSELKIDTETILPQEVRQGCGLIVCSTTS